jgi:hypothetical protein
MHPVCNYLEKGASGSLLVNYSPIVSGRATRFGSCCVVVSCTFTIHNLRIGSNSSLNVFGSGNILIDVLYEDQRLSRVVNSPASYTGGTGFGLETGYPTEVCCFLSTSGRIPG